MTGGWGTPLPPHNYSAGRPVGRLYARGRSGAWSVGVGPLHALLQTEYPLLTLMAGQWWLQLGANCTMPRQADVVEVDDGQRHYEVWAGTVRLAVHRIPGSANPAFSAGRRRALDHAPSVLARWRTPSSQRRTPWT